MDKRQAVRRQRSLGWLLAGVLALPVLTLGMVAFLLWRGAADISDGAAAQLRQSVSAAADQARDIITSTQKRLDQYVSTHAASTLSSGPAAPTSLRDAQGLFGLVFVYDDAGYLTGVDGQQDRTLSVSTRDYFAELRAGAMWSTSAMLEQSAFGEPVFAVARRLAAGEQFVGAAVMYVPADAVGATLPAFSSGAVFRTMLYRENGAIVGQNPPSTTSPRPLASGTIDRMTSNDGILEASGGDFLVAYRRIDTAPALIATVDVARGQIAAAAWSRTSITLLAVGPVAVVLLLVCALMVIALVRQRKDVAALDAALLQNETLLQEIHHRIKNNLSMVVAMIRLQPGDEANKQTLASRIQAMTAVHQLMYEKSAFAFLDAKTYVSRLLASLVGEQHTNVMVEQDVDPVQLSADQVQPIGMLINEAVTNAFKHAFPAGREGVIHVALKRDGDMAELIVSDDGVGTDITSPQRMGSKLMRNLARQLGGELRQGAEKGSRISVRFPLQRDKPV